MVHEPHFECRHAHTRLHCGDKVCRKTWTDTERGKECLWRHHWLDVAGRTVTKRTVLWYWCNRAFNASWSITKLFITNIFIWARLKNTVFNTWVEHLSNDKQFVGASSGLTQPNLCPNHQTYKTLCPNKLHDSGNQIHLNCSLELNIVI